MANTNIILKQGDTLSVSVEPVIVPPAPTPNQPPLVSAGADKTIKLPVSEVLLSGTASDPDNDALTYQWTMIQGASGAVIQTSTAKDTKVTGLKVGVYVFKFTVKDAKGLTTADDVQITVQAADIVPVPVPGGKYLTLPVSAKKDISGQSNLVIENLRFEKIDGNAIRAGGCNNITIRNCFFNGSTLEAVDLENSSNVTVENCLFARVITGVYALNCQNIKVNNNQAVNVTRNAGGGRGQLAQFNSVHGTSNEIINNRSQAWPGEGNGPEDHISLYKSSNVVVRGNILVGGGPSDSGSGIMTGDNGGDNQLVENNTILNTGNAGIGVASGTNIRVLNNKIYSIQTSVSNNPLYVWNQSATPCGNITVQGNFVNWTDKGGGKNNGWNGGGCDSPYNPAENKTITLAEMGVPSHLITFVTEAELLTIRK